MARLPLNYRANIQAKFRSPTGHLSITSRGSDAEAKNLRNLGAIGGALPDLQKDYFGVLGQDGTLDDLFGGTAQIELDPNYKVTYTYKENYEVGLLPNLKDIFPVNICNIVSASPVVLESSTAIRVQDREIIQMPEMVDYPELSNQSFYVKVINKTSIALYHDIYLNTPVNGSGFPVFSGTCAIPTLEDKIVDSFDGTVIIKRAANPIFDLDGNIIELDIIEGDIIEGRDNLGNKLIGGTIGDEDTPPTITLPTPLNPDDIKFPFIIDGNIVGPLPITGTEETPNNPDEITPIIKKGTPTNPSPEGESINLIIPAVVDEGQPFAIRLETTGFAEGTTFDYVMRGNGVTPEDLYEGSLSGTFTIDATGADEIPYQFLADQYTEGLEVVEIELVSYPIIGNISINDTSTTPPPSVTVTPVLTPVAESGAVEFDISVVSYPVGTTFDYTLYGDVDAGDFADGLLAGSITYNGVSPIRVTHALAEDFTTEGDENCYLTITGMEADPNATGLVVISDTSTDPTYNVSANSSFVGENSELITITLTTTNVPDGSVFPYTVTGIDPADVTGDPLSGNVTVNGGTGTINFTTVPDETTEGPETLVFTLTSLGIGTQVTINDTSQTPVTIPVEVQISFTANDWDGVVRTPAPSFTEASTHARQIHVSRSTVTKGSDAHGSYFDIPILDFVTFTNPAAFGTPAENPTMTVSPENPISGLSSFQFHIVARMQSATVSSDHPWMMWGQREGEGVQTYYGERVYGTDFDSWSDRVVFNTTALEDYATVSRDRTRVYSYFIERDNANLNGNYEMIFYRDGVEAARTEVSAGAANWLIEIGQINIGQKFPDISRGDGADMRLYEVHFHSGNDFTYFTNKHNELRTNYNTQ